MTWEWIRKIIVDPVRHHEKQVEIQRFQSEKEQLKELLKEREPKLYDAFNEFEKRLQKKTGRH